MNSQAYNKRFNLKKPPCFNLCSVEYFEVFFTVSSSVQAVFQVNLSVGKGLCSLSKPDMFLSDPRMACYPCADEGV